MKKLLLTFLALLILAVPAMADGQNSPVAVKTDEGVFLSWPMEEAGREYTVYRDGEAIATTKLTNYTDLGADGSGEYSIDGKAVTVWSDQYLEIPVSVPVPYTKAEQQLRHVTVKPLSGPEMNIGSDWTLVPGVDVNWAAFPDEGYCFFAAPDGNVIDVVNALTEPGTGVGTYSHNNGDWQKFRFEETPGGYYMRDKHSQLYLSVDGEGAITLQEIARATVFSVADDPAAPADEVTALADRIAAPPTYSPNDASVGDLDGDGEWEIVLKWDPSNAKDASNSGATGRVFIDAYKLNGTQLWRIDLGKNIRAGAHDTQFVVYDFDGDGRAEVALRISDGTIDGTGAVIGDGEKDWRDGGGRNLTGPLWLAVFDGQTGALLDKVDYDPQNVGLETSYYFGDNYGNRSERYNACVAYLDGEKPYMVFQRGYYGGRDNGPGRTVLAAYSFENGKITQYWRFDTMDEGNEKYIGQGNHNISVADGDNDGCDEIYLGSLTIDHDGSVLWCSGRGHGDAMHLGDFDPSHEGLEFFTVHESGPYGFTIFDAATGEVLHDIPGSKDTGRGIIVNAGPFRGSYIVNVGSGARRINSFGEDASDVGDYGQNFRIYWDGDLYDELLGGTGIAGHSDKGEYIALFDAAEYDCASNNGTKSNPCLTADIFGDWREEVIYRKADNSAIRIFTTTAASDFALPSLMTDHVYRMGVVWQNSSYNQPPHIGYYLGDIAELRVGSSTARVNGMLYGLDAAPFVSEDRTLVPLRFIGDAMGAKVDYEDGVVPAVAADKTVVMTIGSTEYTVNGEARTMETAPVIESDRTMVPLRALSEALGLLVDWDGSTGTITVTRRNTPLFVYESGLLPLD